MSPTFPTTRSPLGPGRRAARPSSARARGTTAGLVVLLALVLGAAACGGQEPAAPADGAAPAADAAPAATEARSYEVRGQITSLPDAADPLSNLTIRHEAIDDFESMQGEVVGMNSMAMPFPVAAGVRLDEFAVGDAIRFTLEVDWDAEPAYQVTRIEPLPEGTELEYDKAQPPAEGP